MSLITRSQKQTLTYWAYTGSDRYGQPTYGPPVQMTCRWDEMIKQVFSSDGSPVFSSIELITRVRLAPKGLVRIGRIPTGGTTPAPRTYVDVYEVIATSFTPNLRNTETLYEAWA